jgi:hypothetical protein
MAWPPINRNQDYFFHVAKRSRACWLKTGEDPIKTASLQRCSLSRWRPNKAKQRKHSKQFEIKPKIRPEINLNRRDTHIGRPSFETETETHKSLK